MFLENIEGFYLRKVGILPRWQKIAPWLAGIKYWKN